MQILKKIFGDPSEKYLKSILSLVEKINAKEKEFEKVADEKLKEITEQLKRKVREGERLENLLVNAFALVREASKRTLKQRHFDVQVMGAIALFHGKIIEMKTGEGKTLTATMPLYLQALEGKGCHLVTVNDYLARRDTVWMGQIFHLLGMSVGCLNHDQSFLYDPEYKKPPEEKEKMRDELGSFYVVEDFLRPCSRKEAYLADITYGTNNEFGFDYLRDNMVYHPDQIVQRGFNFAIVDEVDSILIDEARTPLIISAPSEEPEDIYYFCARLAENLQNGLDYQVDEKDRTFQWLEKGQEKIVSLLKFDPWDKGDFKIIHKLENAIRAKEFFHLDKDYVIKNGEIVIVSEFTGRLMPGRRWSAGIHQAVEAKEHIRGHKNVRVKRESVTLATITFQNYFRMYKKLSGMTGTAITSAEEFEKVYGLQVVQIPTHRPMIRVDLPDRIFKTEKAKFNAIVEKIKESYEKGQPVLVGTRSIEKNEYLSKLLKREGIPHQILNAKHHEKEAQVIAQAGRFKSVTIATNMAGRGVDIILGGNPPDEKEAEMVRNLGGLFVLGTERHEAQRIDNQLRGRAGRQGDPGMTQFFLSLEDELIRIFGGEKIKTFMDTLKLPEDLPIESEIITKLINEAQARVEGINFDIRKNLLRFDEVMEKQRKSFYQMRSEILFADKEKLKRKVEELIMKIGEDPKEFKGLEEFQRDEAFSIIKTVFLTIYDTYWVDYLETIEDLKDSVNLRAFGQMDPLLEYKKESHILFKRMISNIEQSLVEFTKRVSKTPRLVVPFDKKIGRNDPCPCGKKDPQTGRPIKYKKCCWPKYG